MITSSPSVWDQTDVQIQIISTARASDNMFLFSHHFPNAEEPRYFSFIQTDKHTQNSIEIEIVNSVTVTICLYIQGIKANCVAITVLENTFCFPPVKRDAQPKIYVAGHQIPWADN